MGWKLKVLEYGKIKSAEIEVSPLTLFVGDNNSGKSYLMALLWGIQNLGVSELISSVLREETKLEYRSGMRDRKRTASSFTGRLAAK